MNGFYIMVTLINIYFEYLKISRKIFAKYIVPILQVYANQFIILLNIITNDHNDDDIRMTGKKLYNYGNNY